MFSIVEEKILVYIFIVQRKHTIHANEQRPLETVITCNGQNLDMLSFRSEVHDDNCERSRQTNDRCQWKASLWERAVLRENKKFVDQWYGTTLQYHSISFNRFVYQHEGCEYSAYG